MGMPEGKEGLGLMVPLLLVGHSVAMPAPGPVNPPTHLCKGGRGQPPPLALGV